MYLLMNSLFYEIFYSYANLVLLCCPLQVRWNIKYINIFSIYLFYSYYCFYFCFLLLFIFYLYESWVALFPKVNKIRQRFLLLRLQGSMMEWLQSGVSVKKCRDEVLLNLWSVLCYAWCIISVMFQWYFPTNFAPLMTTISFGNSGWCCSCQKFALRRLLSNLC